MAAPLEPVAAACGAIDLIDQCEFVKSTFLRRDEPQLAELARCRNCLSCQQEAHVHELLDPQSQPTGIDAVFLLLKEALRGAGSARFITKSASQKSPEVDKIAGGTGAKPDKKLDSRGKEFAGGPSIW